MQRNYYTVRPLLFIFQISFFLIPDLSYCYATISSFMYISYKLFIVIGCYCVTKIIKNVSKSSKNLITSLYPVHKCVQMKEVSL